MSYKIIVLLTYLSLGSFQTIFSQKISNSFDYSEKKKNGFDVSSYNSNVNISSVKVQSNSTVILPETTCECYIEPDASYTIDAGLSNTDDGNSVNVSLPFIFCFYGTNYTDVFINANGNISFGQAYASFSSNPFPDASFTMIAPFWGDVDTQGAGTVSYKVTSTALYVNWEEVGYYSVQTDKKNSFQVIITDGTDEIIGDDNNVAFCYKDMQWTTGSASGGSNGFGGTPATVGANKGDGTNYIQFGRFDQVGDAYDGPFLANDGVDFLDNKSFKFNTCVTDNNIPPIPLSVNNCDTIQVCSGEEFTVDFVSPENGQLTLITVDNSSAPNFSIISSTPATIGSLTGIFNGSFNSSGINKVTFIATDDGSPSKSTSVEVVFNVLGSDAIFDISPENKRNYVDEANTFLNGSQISLLDEVDEWVWDFGDGNTSSEENPLHNYADSGYYQINLSVYTKGGCEAHYSDSITILPDLLPANVFTPNGDRNNDFYSIKGLHFYNNVFIQVYNRWGQLVFEDENYIGLWDGKDMKGKDLKEGKYYYYIKNEEFREELKGTINIFR